MPAEGDLETMATHVVPGWHPRAAPPAVAGPQSAPWTYRDGDPAIALFTAAVDRFGMQFRPSSRIVELGCCETDWLQRMHAWDPTFDLVGVDTRATPTSEPGITIMQASAMDPELFAPESVDWVVLLGALEHFGLGYYRDPVDEWGDRRTMQNVARWLRPGGFVYFDVPCQPTSRVSPDRCFRMYAPMAVRERLIVDGLCEVNRAYSLPEPWAGTWCHEPATERVPYWFVAVLAQQSP